MVAQTSPARAARFSAPAIPGQAGLVTAATEALNEVATAPGASVANRTRWCSTCGSLPTPETRAETKSMRGLRPTFSLPCSVHGCNGEVLMSAEEYRSLAAAGLVMMIGTDLGSIGLVLEKAKRVMEAKDATYATQLKAAELLLKGSNDRMDRAGMGAPSKNSPSVVVNVGVVDEGDGIDQELDEMYRESQGGGPIDVETVPTPSVPRALPRPVPKKVEVPDYADDLKVALGFGV